MHDPIAAHGQNEQAGAETLPVIADTVQYVDGAGEVVNLVRFVRGGAAKIVAGASSYFARKGGCFVAGTLVQMADGTTKPIEQIKAGDYVKSRNPKTGQTEAKRVLQTTVRQTDQVLTLALTDPKTGHQELITTTGEHPFYVDGQGFVKAGDLGIGTSIVTRAGPTLTLSHLTWQNAAPSNNLLLDGQTHEGGYTVYNLIVDADHTYFVGATGGGAWVHNIDCPIPVVAGEAGSYGDLSRQGRSVVGDELTAHHMPQNALGYLPENEGGAIVLPFLEHIDTRTYGSAGRATKILDAGKPFREVLAKDIRDVRSIAGAGGNLKKYNPGIRELLRYYRSNYPGLIQKPARIR